MYEISNRHRDELIQMLTVFFSDGRKADDVRMYNLRRRARLLVRALQKKSPIR